MDRPHRVIAGLALAIAWSSVACREAPPPLGEALLVVDTDLPVPLLAGELRIDVYDADDGHWYESRTVPLPDPRDWPASFSIYNPNEEGELSALIRLRVYPRGKLRDYRGERFVERPGPGVPAFQRVLDAATPIDLRLVVDEVDRTPAKEPEPTLAVDRLIPLELAYGRRAKVQVVMRGACVGTMADLFGGRSCVATEGVVEPLAGLAAEDDMAVPTDSQQGTFAIAPDCTVEDRPGTTAPSGAPMYDDAVCVPGGPMVFGNADTFGVGNASGVPERVALVNAFVMDRYEVTVARWRQTVAEGFTSPDTTPITNEVSLSTTADIGSHQLCTWSLTRDDREDMPLNCVSWTAARAFCQYHGGDLPIEAQWEYAAKIAGRGVETLYPYGDADPSCQHVVYGRLLGGNLALAGGNQCLGEVSPGPIAVGTLAAPGDDVTPGLGLVGMAGSMSEFMLDAGYPLVAACWARASLVDPWCIDESALTRSLRGGSWTQSSAFLNPSLRPADNIVENGQEASQTWQGFRCVYPGGTR